MDPSSASNCRGATVSGSTITYSFTRVLPSPADPPVDDNYFVYIQKSPPDHKFYVELDYDSPLTLTATLGGTTASFSGNAIVVSYESAFVPIPSDAPGRRRSAPRSL
jgi:hypothetical protein